VYNSTEIYEYFLSTYGKECQFNYLRFPKFQNISNLPEYFKNKIISDSRLPQELLKQLKFELYSQENLGMFKAIKFYTALDKQRGLNITEYLEEFNELVDYERSERAVI
jgi:hypothetical protein